MTREPIRLTGMTFQVLGRATTETTLPDEPYLHISIHDPHTSPVTLPDNPRRVASLFLTFEDSDHPERGMTEAQAAALVSFVRQHQPRITRIVCNCEAGISRSAGVAAALARWLTGDDAPFFVHFIPNRFVYRRILNAAIGAPSAPTTPPSC
jgi:predicted protein tyrosine phosphatase